MFVNRDLKRSPITIWLVSIYLLLVLMVGVGGLTRLTDSGLSITEWELFTGILPPILSSEWEFYFSEYKKIPEFIYQNSDISLDEFKIIFYWEYFHRLLGRFIGLISIIPLFYFFYKYRGQNISLLKYSLIFVLVCAQGFLGWYMVQSGLVERIDVSHYRLASHLFLAFIIISLTFWFIMDSFQIKGFTKKLPSLLLITILLFIFIQIVLGAFLAGLDGGLIYNTWPDMNGNLFPNDYNKVNFLSYDLFNSPSIVQFIHRKVALLLVILILYLNIIYVKKKLSLFPLVIFNFTILFQIFIGVITLLSGAKIFYASLHQLGSILVVSSFLYIFFKNIQTNLQPLD
ncbi:COX15/CtaA family protein [Pelagibacterales bacterium SAG-MED15]|nr:COX15/CtaA family protein [Pelagibacterales bacterium SAG-MED15]